jgi:hypothetical protein
LPVPLTVAEQALVCDAVIEDGEHEIVTEVMADDAAKPTTTLLEPDFVVSCVEVAVMVAVPVALGVNTPAGLIVPIFGGLIDQFTAVL